MKISEIRQTLSEHGLLLTKSLGQNFLHDQNVLRKIVALAEPRPGEKVLEIGPGLGSLTSLLLETGASIFAIEKDRRLCQLLSEKFPHSNFRLLHADALKYLQQNSEDWSGWKVVSNLPYSVASPILVELALAAHSPERLVVTLQLEVAERLAARPGKKQYGQLSLFVQLRYQPIGMFKIAASCFFPPPDVDSACIILKKREIPLLPVSQTETFKSLVKRSFSERRKMMFKLLKEYWPEQLLRSAFQQGNISMQARAESVSLEQFAELAAQLSVPFT